MFEYIENGSITSVEGIKAAGLNCGLKKKNYDLALITSDFPANAAGTFTLNKVQAAPILVSKEIIANGGKVKAILVNSANANACTGDEGYNDAIDVQNTLAEQMNFSTSEVLISSTGVIGQRLQTDKIKDGIEKIIPSLSSSGGIDAAKAIMTTDKSVKHFALKLSLNAGEINIGGICKGSGMIFPNMATMLAFVATDADIEKPLLQKALSQVVNETFNRISVDGETSTNDMVILLSNGAKGTKIEEDSTEYKKFYTALKDICTKMAISIVADGEGATKLVTVTVRNAKSLLEADSIAKSIANSPLVKTAINGQDANWGRIISAAGNSGVEMNPNKTAIFFDNHPVLLPGYKIVIDEEKVKEILSQKEFKIDVDLDDGVASTTWWTCDFSKDYIQINANYRT